MGIPHFLWKSWEGGKLKLLLQDLYTQTLDTGEESTKERRGVIVSYILRNLKTHNVYVYKFIFCEFLNLVNVIGQMYLMDVFFNGYFTTYGSSVLTPWPKFSPKCQNVRSISMVPLVASSTLMVS